MERQGNSPTIPTGKTILAWFWKFQQTGSVRNQFVGSSRTVRTPANIDGVREAVERSPARSTRRQSQALNLSNTTLRRIMHKYLMLYPYNIQIVHQLSPQDRPNRLEFSYNIQIVHQLSPQDRPNRLEFCQQLIVK
ncbi:hypothetical protein QE152_g20740 [Popillia japonica]|uniref:DUF4817 domain-containing protein n=1 Tax=Popillia japonica TaxID=7064 RepID=A0AAW1KPM6_POPJA